jgi:hypothetical protein
MPPEAVFDGVEVGSVRRNVIKLCRTRQGAFIDEFALVAPEAISDQHDGRVRRPLWSFGAPYWDPESYEKIRRRTGARAARDITTS